MICPWCKRDFDDSNYPLSRKFCSTECAAKAYKANVHVDFPVREFYCAHCGKHVITDGKNDRRRRFCCKECEKKYWKHPPENWANNTNYHSQQEYESHEQLSNQI